MEDGRAGCEADAGARGYALNGGSAGAGRGIAADVVAGYVGDAGVGVVVDGGADGGPVCGAG